MALKTGALTAGHHVDSYCSVRCIASGQNHSRLTFDMEWHSSLVERRGGRAEASFEVFMEPSGRVRSSAQVRVFGAHTVRQSRRGK
jgi:hypothetical protein